MQRKIQIVYSLGFLAEEIFLDILAKESNSYFIDLKKTVKEEIRSNTDLGKEIKKCFDSGELLKDSLINALIFREIEKYECDIILTNYPRSIKQFEIFSDSAKSINLKIFRFWKLTSKNIEKIAENKIEKLGEVHCSKVDITLDSMKKEIEVRLINLNNSSLDLIKTKNIKVCEIDVDFEQDLTTLFREKIYSA
ncbi:nucleoside monophosphate kinase [Tenacibaculum ovolyticum]|uniref:nucleoside monophosphate kinase n=1 Tax=Tenacibaculum ovolyticum TaxID=104270 RepID=UPI003BAAEF10